MWRTLYIAELVMGVWWWVIFIREYIPETRKWLIHYEMRISPKTIWKSLKNILPVLRDTESRAITHYPCTLLSSSLYVALPFTKIFFLSPIFLIARHFLKWKHKIRYLLENFLHELVAAFVNEVWSWWTQWTVSRVPNCFKVPCDDFHTETKYFTEKENHLEIWLLLTLISLTFLKSWG